jgi:ketosteroid isomerase-like protein
MSMPSRERVLVFIERVVSGDHVGAIEDFYTEDASMQENGNPPRVGRSALVEHETKALACVAEMRTLPVDHFAIYGDTVFIHWIFDMVAKDGTIRRLDEIAVQQWRGDRIFRERFYYDPAVFTT